MSTEERDVLQFSVDVEDGEYVNAYEIRRVLEEAGFYVRGVSWRARWTPEAYDNGEDPYSYD